MMTLKEYRRLAAEVARTSREAEDAIVRLALAERDLAAAGTPTTSIRFTDDRLGR